MKVHSALTLIELMLVIGLIALLSGGFFMAITTIRNRQALATSVEVFSNAVEQARINSQDEKNGRTWGVKTLDASSFAIFSKSAAGEKRETNFALDDPVRFQTLNAVIWFNPVTGATANETNVIMSVLPRGDMFTVTILPSGLTRIQ